MSEIQDYCDLLEKVAEMEHKQWAHWINYQLENEDSDEWEKWVEQAQTPYHLLTEKEKKSDREWARKVLALVNSELKELLQIKSLDKLFKKNSNVVVILGEPYIRISELLGFKTRAEFLKFHKAVKERR